MQRRPILIVDDDTDVVAIARATLEHSGWLVIGLCDSREALDVAAREKPCLVLVDLMMPHLDGEEFVVELRKRLANDAPPIALISAAYARADVAKRLGLAASLPKPFEIADLRDLAARFSGAHRDRPPSLPP